MLLAAHHSKCSSKLYLLARAKSQERFEKHSAEILAKFERDEAAGFYIVGKIANQLIAHDDISQMRAKAGKKGGLAKQQKKLQAIAIANDNQLLTESDSESDIKPSSELESSSDSASSQKKEPSQAACRLAVLLKAEIQRNKIDYWIAPQQERKWSVTAQRMLDIDKRDAQAAANLIRREPTP